MIVFFFCKTIIDIYVSSVAFAKFYSYRIIMLRRKEKLLFSFCKEIKINTDITYHIMKNVLLPKSLINCVNFIFTEYYNSSKKKRNQNYCFLPNCHFIFMPQNYIKFCENAISIFILSYLWISKGWYSNEILPRDNFFSRGGGMFCLHLFALVGSKIETVEQQCCQVRSYGRVES